MTIIPDRAQHKILVTPPRATNPIRGSRSYPTEQAAVIASFEALMWVKDKIEGDRGEAGQKLAV